MMRTVFLFALALAGMVQAEVYKDDGSRACDGGTVLPPDNGRRVVVVDTCGLSTNVLKRLSFGTEDLLYIPLKVVSGAPRDANPYRSAKAYKDDRSPALVYIHAGAKDDPILTVYMEEAIATINVTPLKSMTREIEENRLIAEFYRGYGIILGAYYSGRFPSALAPAYGLGQIDNLRIKIFSPMHMSAIAHTAKQLGLPLLRPTSYRSACQHGWAPPPTNDVQKAIWDAVHNEKERGPAKGLKIRPPVK